MPLFWALSPAKERHFARDYITKAKEEKTFAEVAPFPHHGPGPDGQPHSRDHVVELGNLQMKLKEYPDFFSPSGGSIYVCPPVSCALCYAEPRR